LAGAYYGLERIPTRWLRRLDSLLLRELDQLSRSLVDGSPLGRGEAPRLSPQRGGA
jgi:ADP-ribosyl-[dinitrogen reductase] hydrolase